MFSSSCGVCGQPTSSNTGFCRRTEECETAYKRQYYNNNKASYRQRDNARPRKQRPVMKRMLSQAKQRAKDKGLDFNIEEEDIRIPERCPILGDKLEVGVRRGPTRHSPSLDRIKPELGYVKGNIQVISFKANVMKQDATIEELLMFASWVHENFS